MKLTLSGDLQGAPQVTLNFVDERGKPRHTVSCDNALVLPRAGETVAWIGDNGGFQGKVESVWHTLYKDGVGHVGIYVRLMEKDQPAQEA